MTDIKLPTVHHVELHLSPDPTFPRKFGKRCRAAYGHKAYTEARGYHDRFVRLPLTSTELIDEILTSCQPANGLQPRHDHHTVIFRVLDGNGYQLPSWVVVQYIAKGQGIAVARQKFEAAFVEAVKRGIVKIPPPPPSHDELLRGLYEKVVAFDEKAPGVRPEGWDGGPPDIVPRVIEDGYLREYLTKKRDAANAALMALSAVESATRKAAAS